MRTHARGLIRSKASGDIPKTRLRCMACGHTKTVYPDGSQPCGGHRLTDGAADRIAADYISGSAASAARGHGCDPKTVRAVFETWVTRKSAAMDAVPARHEHTKPAKGVSGTG